MDVAQVVLLVVTAYVAIGLIVAVPFVSIGIQRVDGAAQGAGLFFRMMMVPGSVALWPVIARRWLAACKRGDA